MSKISNLIVSKRQEKGLSQYDLANEVNVSVTDVDKWEKAEVEPTLDELNNICKVLGITQEEINDSANIYAKTEVGYKPAKSSKKAKTARIANKVGSVIIILSIMAYLLVGVFANMWHPTWVMMPLSILLAWVINIIFDKD